MEALTYDRAVELAREVVAEFGQDYVYPEDHKVKEYGDGDTNAQCVYVREDAPSCIVGQILYRHGVSCAAMALEEFRNARHVARELADADEKTRFFLSMAQDYQDKGKSWGESLAWAIHETARYYQ